MIRSTRGKLIESIIGAKKPKGFPADLIRRAEVKVALVDAAQVIEDLRAPPGNRLEKLSGDRAGQHAIRINDQWRVCFRWDDGDAHDVEIVDYH